MTERIPDSVFDQADRVELVDIEPAELLERVPADKRAALIGVLAQDPRPPYQDDPNRIYGFPFAGLELRFRVDGETLTVVDVL